MVHLVPVIFCIVNLYWH